MFRGPDGRTIDKNVLRYTTLIGSGPRCNIQLLDPAIAEAHCIVTLESGVLRVRDLRSATGTHVNGRSVTVANLAAGDTIEVGRFSFLLATNLDGSHVAAADIPESAADGPLRALRDGDPIELDVDAGRLDVDVPAAELATRLERLGPAEPRYRRGYGAMFLEHVLQADEGCDFDFLRARPGDAGETEPYGLLSGWVGGW